MGILNKVKFYTIGPIQNSNSSDDFTWRDKLRKELNPLGIIIFDPTLNMVINFPSEGEGFHKELRKIIQIDYDDAHKKIKDIVRRDLSLVDRADAIIVYINPDVASWGSAHELTIAQLLRKPIFFICKDRLAKMPLWVCGLIDKPSYIYDNVDDVVKEIKLIDSGEIQLNNKKWRLLEESIR